MQTLVDRAQPIQNYFQQKQTNQLRKNRASQSTRCQPCYWKGLVCRLLGHVGMNHRPQEASVRNNVLSMKGSRITK